MLQTLHSLIGTWQLVSYQAISTADSEDIIYPLGQDAKGSIMYSHDGYMSAILLRPGQLPYTTAEPGTASVSELAESARRFLSYSGPFYLSESTSPPSTKPNTPTTTAPTEPRATTPRTLIRHLLHLVNFPNWLGNVQTRVVELSTTAESPRGNNNKRRDRQPDTLTLGLESVVDMNGVWRNPLLIFTRAERNDVLAGWGGGTRRSSRH